MTTSPAAARPRTVRMDQPVFRNRVHTRRSLADNATWLGTQKFIVLATVVLLGMRVNVVSSLGVTAGLIVGIALIPLWITTVVGYRGAALVLAGGLATVVSGGILTQLHSHDHQTSTKLLISNSVMVATLLVGAGVIMWGRSLLRPGLVVSAFGLGMILGISSASGLFSSNPWRFGFSVPITVFILGLATMSRSRPLELMAAVVLLVVSAMNDARSSSAILLLTALFVVWQMFPRSAGRKGSALRIVLGVVLLAAVVYYVGENLILSGSLGEETQQRSQAQIDTSGSLILGGRPELAATADLMLHYPSGFGAGTVPAHAELNVAKAGMAAINYDPDNGYVERFMFGSGFELHSTFGDYWANFGVVGLAFVVILAVMVLRGFGDAMDSRAASAIVLFLTIKFLWNVFFAPAASALPLMMLLLGLILVPRATGGRVRSDTGTGTRFPGPRRRAIPTPRRRRES